MNPGKASEKPEQGRANAPRTNAELGSQTLSMPVFLLLLLLVASSSSSVVVAIAAIRRMIVTGLGDWRAWEEVRVGMNIGDVDEAAVKFCERRSVG